MGADVWWVNLAAGGLAAVCDDLDLYEAILRQHLHSYGRACGEGTRELLLIDGVHSSEVAHISEEARGLDDLIDGEASFSEDRVDIAEDLLGLSGDAFGELARSGIDTELTRCEEHISDADSLTVRADSGWCLGGGNDLLHE